MLGIKLICVGKMREKHYIAAFEEYAKRLGAYCRFETAELPEARLPERPSEKEIEAALERESAEIRRLIPKGASTVAMCIEGERFSSGALEGYLAGKAAYGESRLCFIVGGSFGLHESVKNSAGLRLSMSDMTFPHHLARVMLSEQLYRALSINEGSSYHK